jgi:hypothetical protein
MSVDEEKVFWNDVARELVGSQLVEEQAEERSMILWDAIMNGPRNPPVVNFTSEELHLLNVLSGKEKLRARRPPPPAELPDMPVMLEEEEETLTFKEVMFTIATVVLIVASILLSFASQ